MGWSRRMPGQSKQTAAFVGSAFEQYHASLHRFLMRRLRSTQNAQDLAQETYLRLLRMDNHELVRKPQAYLYRVASNLVYEFKLRERNAPVAFDSEALEHAAEHPAEIESVEPGESLSVNQQLEAVLTELSAAVSRGVRSAETRRHVVSGDCPDARHLGPHGEEVPGARGRPVPECEMGAMTGIRLPKRLRTGCWSSRIRSRRRCATLQRGCNPRRATSRSFCWPPRSGRNSTASIPRVRSTSVSSSRTHATT